MYKYDIEIDKAGFCCRCSAYFLKGPIKFQSGAVSASCVQNEFAQSYKLFRNSICRFVICVQ